MISARKESTTREEEREAGGSLVFGRGYHGRVRAESQGVGHLGDPELLVVSLPGRVHEIVIDEVDVLDRQGWKSRKESERERSARTSLGRK
jgi:hypothetical protein